MRRKKKQNKTKTQCLKQVLNQTNDLLPGESDVVSMIAMGSILVVKSFIFCEAYSDSGRMETMNVTGCFWPSYWVVLGNGCEGCLLNRESPTLTALVCRWNLVTHALRELKHPLFDSTIYWLPDLTG